jgi:hypothetical protein
LCYDHHQELKYGKVWIVTFPSIHNNDVSFLFRFYFYYVQFNECNESLFLIQGCKSSTLRYLTLKNKNKKIRKIFIFIFKYSENIDFRFIEILKWKRGKFWKQQIAITVYKFLYERNGHEIRSYLMRNKILFYVYVNGYIECSWLCGNRNGNFYSNIRWHLHYVLRSRIKLKM